MTNKWNLFLKANKDKHLDVPWKTRLELLRTEYHSSKNKKQRGSVDKDEVLELASLVSSLQHELSSARSRLKGCENRFTESQANAKALVDHYQNQLDDCNPSLSNELDHSRRQLAKYQQWYSELLDDCKKTGYKHFSSGKRSKFIRKSA
jgi:hypothetical protein